MKKFFCVLLFAILCLFAFGGLSGADPKAYDYCGFINPSGKLGESERAALEASLEEIYGMYGLSVFLCLLSDEDMSMSDYVMDFYEHSVAPWIAPEGEINYCLIFAWDEKTGDNHAAPFSAADGLVMEAFPPDYLNSAISSVSSSLGSASSTFKALSNLADALQKRAGEYFPRTLRASL
ncbi:MAG: hypothetical protein FWE49_06595 [Synergistaceae bacterium]|nr:hypothetical protein [Synergistaceae bacterium]